MMGEGGNDTFVISADSKDGQFDVIQDYRNFEDNTVDPAESEHDTIDLSKFFTGGDWDNDTLMQRIRLTTVENTEAADLTGDKNLNVKGYVLSIDESGSEDWHNVAFLADLDNVRPLEGTVLKIEIGQQVHDLNFFSNPWDNA